MKFAADFICDCKTETQFDYDEPGTLARNAQIVQCKNCRSLYTLAFRKRLDGKVEFTLSLSKPTRILADYLAREEAKKKENLPQKKPTLFTLKKH